MHLVPACACLVCPLPDTCYPSFEVFSCLAVCWHDVLAAVLIYKGRCWVTAETTPPPPTIHSILRKVTFARQLARSILGLQFQESLANDANTTRNNTPPIERQRRPATESDFESTSSHTKPVAPKEKPPTKKQTSLDLVCASRALESITTTFLSQH
ncbi:hypothetical protein K456DRAFT_1529656 [Colletotrichum gloeosporioides 23]|nr:hypothetical protein K456DRAFT_1529656 [Colletotrichum gloeosporioides 23]